MNNWLKKLFGRASSDIIESVYQDWGPYEVYSDDNYDKEGNSQGHVGTYSSLEEAIHCCQIIVGKSVEGSTAYCHTPEAILKNWRFGGTTAFIRGSDAFSAEAYAEQAATEICSDLQKEHKK